MSLSTLANPNPTAFSKISDVTAFLLAHAGFELVEARTRNFHPSVQLARVEEAVKTRAKFVADTLTRGGILLWRSNERPVPAHVFADAGLLAHSSRPTPTPLTRPPWSRSTAATSPPSRPPRSAPRPWPPTARGWS